MKYYLGLDVGSVSTDIVVLDENENAVEKLYLKTAGKPINAVKSGLAEIKRRLGDINIQGVGTTGSGRQLAGVMVGADVTKNEITSHGVAALKINPDVKTIFEIGGQDSKIIIIRDGVIVDFAMNTVCAAGTGSFLDRQASRLNIPIEEFGDRALKSTTSVRIAGRCAVFAESDMIHKQQLGYSEEDIINGLCEALVRNYLNNVGKGKEILSPIIFQGGVAANKGMKKAFEQELGQEIYIPENHDVMGAIGAAIIAKSNASKKKSTSFYGFNMIDFDYKTRSFECSGCSNLCEVVEIYINDRVGARWGGRCGKWNQAAEKEKIEA
ncbi:R-phenyllactate dehydratase activator [Oxobacter pfennigii]|uniref:R-phenyllactate dehydratase activator n=1 Tax=Oxobacter pfennigii TaxID=36849 RepID=A0A0P8WTS0_9CLOT|nr:acyl-CoA dehydratase activase [Oxobacter pfennigii]KPU46051.1 R-phenyllactate dehydratase activator [Oxobacter pfennigii]